MIMTDLESGYDNLPQMERLVAEAKKDSPCGNVYLGDIKPNKIIGYKNLGLGNDKRLSAKEADRRFQQLFDNMEKSFPKATWLWLIRHPDKWATSLSHWYKMKDSTEADQFLQKVRQLHARFHCSAWKHFGKRIIGQPDGNVQGNGKGDVVQMNLEQLDWPLFVQQLQDASGYQGLKSESEMPHVGHHPPSWTYPVPDTKTWNPSDYLKEACELAARDEFLDFESTPWDDEEDSGL